MPASVSSQPSHGDSDLNPPLLPPSPEPQRITYAVYISTAKEIEAGTDKNVYLCLTGDLADTQFHLLSNSQSNLSSSPLPPASFPMASVCDFMFTDVDVGNLVQATLRHDADDDKNAAWKPIKVVVENTTLHRSWTFVCPRWLSCELGNEISMPPTGYIAVGSRASRRASRRISDNSNLRTPTTNSAESRIRFETLRDRFSETQAGDVVANGTDVGTKRVRFSLQKFSNPNAHLYLSGSIPALGKYKPQHAVRMTPSCQGMEGYWRGEWSLDIEIDDDYDKIHYRYMVVYEDGCRRVSITEPEYELNLSSYTTARHAEGNVITIKNIFRTNMEGDPLAAASGYYPEPDQSSIINTPNGRARLMNHPLTPNQSVPIAYAVQHNVNGALESNMVEPVSSESSLSVPRASEDCSMPHYEHVGNGEEQSGEATLRNMSHWTHTMNDMELSERYNRSSGRHRRRQSSDEMSTDSTSSHMRSAEKRSSRHRRNARRQHDNSGDYSPRSSETHQGENQGDELKQLKEEYEALQAEQNRTAAERDGFELEVNNLRLELDSTVREHNNFQEELETQDKAVGAQFDKDEEIKALHDRLDEVSSERDAAYEAMNASKSERNAALQNYEVIRKERDEALVQAENVNPKNDATLIEIGNLRNQEQTVRQDRDAILAERDLIAQENKALQDELERTRAANMERSRTFSRLSDTHKTMLDELEELRSEVVLKQEEIEAQAADLNRILAEKQAEVDAQLREAEEERVDLHERWIKEFHQRRKLFNTIQELRGNIRVFCRVRPMKTTKINSSAVSFPNDGIDDSSRIVLSNKTFEFDQVFQPASSQREVYDETAGVVQSVVDGYNVCVFAYGQTGSGKTYTMNGSEQDRGVNYRALESLFAIAAERNKSDTDVRISVSMLEIYNENLRDLIIPDHLASSPPKLEIRKDASTKSNNAVHVPNLTEVEVTCFENTWDVMERGSLNRSKGRTDMNEHSSRSHLIVRVTVWCEDNVNGERTRGVLHLVDLAGSERISRSNASGDRLKEAQHINKSLSSLGDVFAALVKPNSSHVPYRNSKLTYLLQDCLGGDSKTLMFVNISGDMSDESETLSSLQFAQRVAKVELGSARKHSERGADPKALQEKESQNAELFSKVQVLQRDLRKRDECIMEMRERERGLQDNVKELTLKECSNREGSAKEMRDLKVARDRDALQLKNANARITELERSKEEEVRRLHTILRSREKEIAGLTVDKGAEEQVRRLQALLHSRDREIAELRHNNNTSGAKSIGNKKTVSIKLAHTVSGPRSTTAPASIPGPFLDRPCSVPSALGKTPSLKDNGGAAQQKAAGDAQQQPGTIPRSASSLPGRSGQIRSDNDSISSADSGSVRSSLEIGSGPVLSASRKKFGPASKTTAQSGANNSLKVGVLAPPRRAKDVVGNTPMRTLSGTRAGQVGVSGPGLRQTPKVSIPGGLVRKAASAYGMRALENSGGVGVQNRGSNNAANNTSASLSISTPMPVRRQLGQTRTSRLPRSQTTMLRPPQRMKRNASADIGTSASVASATGRTLAGRQAADVRSSGNSGPSSSGGSSTSSSTGSDRALSLKMPLRRAGTVSGARLVGPASKAQPNNKN